jgi:DNA polymerase elongation subunit (family B)
MFANAKSCNDKKQWGFLPRLINNIVEQRKACKKKMKKATNPAEFFIL